MTPYRHALLAVLALALSAGCRTAGMGNLTPTKPLAPRASMEAAELIQEHNRNAERIQSLKAEPGIQASFDGGGGAGLTGHLALERPRNFKLEVATHMKSVADIGSNDREFWFWTAPARAQDEKAIYFCNHDDLARAPLAATFQPDWIIEAMGLRVIGEDEAGEIRVKRDTKSGRLILTHAPTKSGAATFTRVTVLDEASHRILEHQVFTADQKTLLARAVVVDGLYTEHRLPGVDGAPGETVSLPAHVKLEWVKEKLTLDVRMRKVQVNPKFPPDQRTALFSEPERKDCARRNLAEMSGGANGAATVRETRPVPPTRVRLGEPSAVGLDDARPTPRGPVALSTATPSASSLLDEVIGPPIPGAPELGFLPSDSPGGRESAPLGMER